MNPTEILLRDYDPADAPSLLALWTSAGMATPGRGDDAAQIARTLAHGARTGDPVHNQL